MGRGQEGPRTVFPSQISHSYPPLNHSNSFLHFYEAFISPFPDFNRPYLPPQQLHLDLLVLVLESGPYIHLAALRKEV